MQLSKQLSKQLTRRTWRSEMQLRIKWTL